MERIHVAHETHIQRRPRLHADWGQCLVDHDRSKVRTSDADVDHMGKPAAICSGVTAFSDLICEGEKRITRGQHFGHDILPCDSKSILGLAAQGHVQDRSAFRLIDGCASELQVPLSCPVCRLGHLLQCCKCRDVNALLGKVKPPSSGRLKYPTLDAA